MRWQNILFSTPLWPLLFAYTLLFAFGVSALCVQIMRKLAPRLGFVDHPAARRRSPLLPERGFITAPR